VAYQEIQQDGDAGGARAARRHQNPERGRRRVPANEHGNQAAGAQRLPGEEIGLQRDPDAGQEGVPSSASALVALSGPLTVTASSTPSAFVKCHRSPVAR
jgi:hypothetical protein